MDAIARITVEFWSVLGLMAPYLLFGFLMGGILSVLFTPKTVERHLGGAGIGSVAKASLFGVPLPLCSCGVIPVAASLRKHGASRGATTAFLLSTPQTGVDSILVTYGLLGLVFAVFRPLAAFVTGLIGGVLVDWWVTDGDGKRNASTPECCSDAERSQSKLLRGLTYGFVTLPRDIGRDLLIGLVIAALISALVPHDFFSGALGTGIGAMLVMMLVGIPIYVCASASVPMAAALIAKGISPGAAFVFLVTGPATNAATMATIRRIMGWRALAIYLGTVAFTALGFGLLLDGIFQLPAIPTAPHIHEMHLGWFHTLCALALLGVLGYAILSGRKETVVASSEDRGQTVAFSIKGMTCEHCVDRIRRTLIELPGVRSAAVDLKSGIATVHAEPCDPPAMHKAVRDLGYEVES